MQRYFIDELNKKNKTAVIEGADFYHIKNVMKFRIGDQVIVCKNGECFQSSIERITLDQIYCSLNKELLAEPKEFKVTIAQGLIKRERFEYMLQKATELGADEIIPIISQESIIKINPQETASKLEQWNKIAVEASIESHRNTRCIVSPVQDLRSIAIKQYDIVLVAYEKENMSHNLKQILQKKFRNILILIGPEGGLSEEEIQYLSGFSNLEFIGLGSRILRSETASSYILSVLHYEYEMRL